MKCLQGRVALVTGAGSGIGRASAVALAQDGATVMLSDIAASGESVVGEIVAAGGRAAFVQADATDERQVAALVQRTLETFGRLDCAHNNVGVGSTGVGVIDQTRDDWDRTLSLSLTSTWLGMKYQIPAMIAAGGGAIVNTASMAGVRYSASASPGYSAAKAGVVHLTLYAANAHASDGIRVNSVSPGFTATPIIAQMFTPQQQADIAAKGQLIQRAVQPSEIADAVVFLCSDRSAMVTGVNLEVCGGKR